MGSRQILALVFIVAGFIYFASRDGQLSRESSQAPEDVLIVMIQSMERGEVDRLLECFGGELGRRLRNLHALVGEEPFRSWLDERARSLKGFAIIDQQQFGPDDIMLMAEAVYENQNTRQQFRLRQEGNRWRIVATDFEMVSDWETDFGKHISEIGGSSRNQ